MIDFWSQTTVDWIRQGYAHLAYAAAWGAAHFAHREFPELLDDTIPLMTKNGDDNAYPA